MYIFPWFLICTVMKSRDEWVNVHMWIKMTILIIIHDYGFFNLKIQTRVGRGHQLYFLRNTCLYVILNGILLLLGFEFVVWVRGISIHIISHWQAIYCIGNWVLGGSFMLRKCYMYEGDKYSYEVLILN